MTAYLIVIYVICGGYLVLNFKHDIHMLQQNSYRIPRYWRYLTKNDIGSSWRLVDVAMLFIACSRLLDMRFVVFLTALLALYKIASICRKKFKKPLVFTRRVWRIYSVAVAIGAGLYLWDVFILGFKADAWGFYSGPVLTVSILLLMTIFSWFIVILSVVLLMPVESMINRKYWNEAASILKSMPDLTVIGITGSYGKTSTKHFLERILSEKYDVLMTPGSYNTTMGVIRTVREYLKPFNNVFICEMGAKQSGDIKEICELVHPKIGIITAVGPMHLETFKTLENVRSTKFELIDFLPSNGFAVINDDFEYCRNRTVDNVEAFRYTVGKDVDFNSENIESYTARNISYTSSGTSFEIVGKNGFEISLNTKLIGECNVSNIMAAVIVAVKMGMSKEEIYRGVASIEPVEHRLSIKRTPGGVTILDDAFNSNPHGSRMALDVLSQFNEGKRIVVTPGMIELGHKQKELNLKFGEHMADSCDVAIIVGHYNREAISEGLRKAEFKGEIYEVDSFDKAQEVLTTIMKRGDTVLYENDLPDSFK
ncbi:MAG: UDP-N-acetylmuramoyl-tripeptide--D-alanyl-D-alanine ligase [Muribaculaceae bacterium]|nr:UDP-N-acetylmuramoyl-tripeptide--D-alanyl-D-alanine ligase [Muribaculaceae bacterium]